MATKALPKSARCVYKVDDAYYADMNELKEDLNFLDDDGLLIEVYEFVGTKRVKIALTLE